MLRLILVYDVGSTPLVATTSNLLALKMAHDHLVLAQA